MKQTTRRATRRKAGINVTLVRPTEEDLATRLPKGATIADVLEELEVEVPSGQSLYVNGVKASEDDEVEDNDIIQIVGKKEGGIK